MAENKVQFNLKNVHYSVLTTAMSGNVETYSYATPVAIPGAVSLSLDPEGDVTPFYADGITYYQSVANNGYSGDLEVAKFPESMLTAVWGMAADTSGVLSESASVEAKPFALLYQIDGDKNNTLFCLYNCSATRPGIGSETSSDTKEPVTQTSSISAAPRGDGKIMARTTGSASSSTISGWFTAVYDS